MLKVNNTTLRPLCQEDAEKLFVWLNNLEVMHFNGLPFRFYSQQEMKDFYFRPRTNQVEGYVLAFVNGDNEPLGIIEYNYIKPIFTGVEVQVVIGRIELPEIINHACDAVTLLAEFIFNELNYERMSVMLSCGLSAMKEKLETQGFVNEAIIREERLIAGKYVDSYCMGLLKGDYKGF